MSRDVAVSGAHGHCVGLSPRTSSEVLGCFHTMRKVLLGCLSCNLFALSLWTETSVGSFSREQ